MASEVLFYTTNAKHALFTNGCPVYIITLRPDPLCYPCDHHCTQCYITHTVTHTARWWQAQCGILNTTTIRSILILLVLKKVLIRDERFCASKNVSKQMLIYLAQLDGKVKQSDHKYLINLTNLCITTSDVWNSTTTVSVVWSTIQAKTMFAQY